MALDARTYTILSVLNDLKDAFTTLLQKQNKHPALLMIYAFIDICAALANDAPSRRGNQAVFVTYLERFMSHGTERHITPKQLWAARSSLLHTFSPLGHHTGPGKAPATFYYTWEEDPRQVRADLEARGYSGFALQSINEIRGIAIFTFNAMIRVAEKDEAFRVLLHRNAEHLLLTQDALHVERFLRSVEEADQTGRSKSDLTP